MKKIMMLGGNFLQMSAIKCAKELGYYVISVDYLPDNPGHKFSDEYHNVSTTDKYKILKLAKELQIDGILSYASDVSAPTAAYVAEKLGLPTNPYKSVEILTHKELFKQFMINNNLRVAKGQAFNDKDAARKYFNNLMLPVIIKPTDSSGSKGVCKVTSYAEFDEAYDEALSYSMSGKVMIEEFISKKGYQIDGDGFIKNGNIEFFGVMDQHNNIIMNPHAPIGLSFPSVQGKIYQGKARKLIQSVFDKLDIKFGAFNFEYIIDENGEINLLEIGPRNGGNFIPDTIKYATGIDMVEASIKACVGDDYSDALKIKYAKNASSYVIHSMETGVFKSLKIHPYIQNRIVKQELFVKPGDKVMRFKNGGDSIGAMVISFDNTGQMNEMMDNMWKYIEVVVE